MSFFAFLLFSCLLLFAIRARATYAKKQMPSSMLMNSNRFRLVFRGVYFIVLYVPLEKKNNINQVIKNPKSFSLSEREKLETKENMTRN